MMEDVNFVNHMYTKISDLKLNKSISDSDDKLKYIDNNFNRITEDSNIKTNRNSDLDYLYYEEPNFLPKKKNKIKKQKIEKNNENNSGIKLYIILFVLFCILNSYFVIDRINSYKIQYKLSLAIRASLFLFLYYLIKKYV
jgi:hypothetical protein